MHSCHEIRTEAFLMQHPGFLIPRFFPFRKPDNSLFCRNALCCMDSAPIPHFPVRTLPGPVQLPLLWLSPCWEHTHRIELWQLTYQHGRISYRDRALPHPTRQSTSDCPISRLALKLLWSGSVSHQTLRDCLLDRPLFFCRSGSSVTLHLFTFNGCHIL